ncbi:MAG: LysR family transcriptional regulator [Myxococcota bacterium]
MTDRERSTEWLNYHHLYYFFVVAREGGVSAAARALRLSHPTLSKQVRQLEESLGETLFERSASGLHLTPAGHRAYAYAHEIFSLGTEMLSLFRPEPGDRPERRLAIGVTAALPKLVTRRLLLPVVRASEDAVRLVVHEDAHERLLARLALRELDLVLADAPVPPGSPVQAFHHRLTESGLTCFAAPSLAARLRGSFPGCLHEAPLILPAAGTALRRVVEPWLDAQDVRPNIVGEMEDLSLLKAFGQSGYGVFFVASLVERDVVETYSVDVLGRTNEVVETFYAIIIQRRVANPLVARICDAATSNLGA